jgi:diacylglycerol O-acyltransferase / trehalose O-mycolyltransferase
VLTRRSQLAAALVLALVAAGCGGTAPPSGPEATVIHERRIGPRVLDINIRSPAVGGTPMVRLLTPQGWSRDAPRRWPVLFLLHGCCDAYDSWVRSTRVEQMPELRRVLVVMPEGGAVGFYSNWLGTDGQRGPAWESFHLRELRGILERDYRAGQPQAVAGLSMGGLGAMSYAARHPGMFTAAASFSGVLHPVADTRFMTGLFAAFTADPDAIWGDPRRDRRVWAAHDPTALAPKLRGTRLFVSAGNGRPGRLDDPYTPPDDIEPTVLRQSRAFVGRLRAEGIPVRVDFYGRGTHSWPYWERELRRALPTLIDRE